MYATWLTALWPSITRNRPPALFTPPLLLFALLPALLFLSGTAVRAAMPPMPAAEGYAADAAADSGFEAPPLVFDPAKPLVLLSGAPESDQLSQIVRLIGRGLTPPAEVRPTPGLTGAYALRDAAADPGLTAALALPAFILMADAPSFPYQSGDVTALFLAGHVPAALWVPQDSPFVSLPDFLAAARQGEGQVICAGPGRYSAAHLALVICNREAGVLTLFLPVLGTAEACAAATQGRVQAVWAYALAPETLPGFRALAVASESRVPALPDTPTFSEYDLRVILKAELGFAAAPRAAGREPKARSLRLGLENPATAEELRRLGFVPSPLEGKDLERYLERESIRLRDMAGEYPRLKD